MHNVQKSFSKVPPLPAPPLKSTRVMILLKRLCVINHILAADVNNLLKKESKRNFRLLSIHSDMGIATNYTLKNPTKKWHFLGKMYI